jgi:hypothetical protein
MSRPRIFAAALLLSLGAPAAYARTEGQSWNRDFHVSRHPLVRIETGDARVMVHAWKEPRVSVKVTSRGQATGLFFGRRRPVVEITQEGNEVHVRARFEGSENGMFVISSVRMEVEVWQPAESDLALHSQDGPTSLEGITGHISVISSDGSVTGHGLKGDLDIHTSDGRVELEDVDGSLRLETQDGRSEVSGRFDAVDVETSDGGINLEALRGSRMGSGWSLRSSDGHIQLRVPPDLAATLDARTSDGGITVDLPVRVQGRTGRHELLGDLKGGGPTLRLRSSDGPIRVESTD